MHIVTSQVEDDKDDGDDDGDDDDDDLPQKSLRRTPKRPSSVSRAEPLMMLALAVRGNRSITNLPKSMMSLKTLPLRD